MSFEEIPALASDEVSEQKSHENHKSAANHSPKFIEHYFQGLLQVIMKLRRL